MKRLLFITLLFSLQLYPHTDQEQQQQYEQFSQDVRSWNPVTMARLALCRPDQQQHDQLRSLAWDSKDKSVLDHLEKTGYKTTDAAEFIKVPFNIVMRNKMLTVALLVGLDFIIRDKKSFVAWQIHSCYMSGFNNGKAAQQSQCRLTGYGCERLCKHFKIDSSEPHTHEVALQGNPDRPDHYLILDTKLAKPGDDDHIVLV